MPFRLLLPATCLLVTAACSASPASTGATGAGGSDPTVTRSGAPPARTTGTLVSTGPGPVGLAVDARGRVWVAHAEAGTVSRVNAAGDGVDLTRRVGTAPLRLAASGGAAGGSIWVTVFSDGSLLRLDDRTGRVTDTLDIGSEPEGVTTAFGGVWVVSQVAAALLRIDPHDGAVTHRYPVGTAPRLVTSGLGALWVSDFGSGRVFRVDPVTGRMRRSASICFGPQGMLVTAETLWVACTTDDSLVGVDPQTLRRTSRLRLPGAPDAVAAGPDGLVLVALQQGPTLAVIDPQGPSVVRRDRLGTVDQLHDRANIDVVYTGGQAWVSSYLEGGVYRVQP